MEIKNWVLGSVDYQIGKISVLSYFFMRQFLMRNFDRYGNLKEDNDSPALIYYDDSGVRQYIFIQKIFKSYVQDVDGKIYKLPGLERFTSNIRFSEEKIMISNGEKYKIQCFSTTGKIHTINEDSYLGIIHPNSNKIKLLVVADGMGGHELGNVASQFLIQKLSNWFMEQSIDNLEDYNWVYREIANLIIDISYDMFFEFRLKKKVKSGSTLALAIINSTHTIMVSVGDSRIGLVQNKKLNIISIDDSPFCTDLPLTPIEQDAIRTIPGHNFITQYVGKREIIPHLYIAKNTDYTDLFLFSDGITDCVNYSTLNRIACNIEKETLFNFILEASFGEETEGAKRKATDDETVVHYARR